MKSIGEHTWPSDAATLNTRRLILLVPASAALAYPFLLKGFHVAVSSADTSLSIVNLAIAVACLLGAIAVPLVGLVFAASLSRTEFPSRLWLRARRLAYFTIAVPPLFVFVGVTRGLLGVPLSDGTLWIVLWLAVCLFVWRASDDRAPVPTESVVRWRVAHGVSAALLATFFLFHLANHLLGAMGPEVHARVMQVGRTIYRSRAIEPLFIAFLLFQVTSGVRLVWRWIAPAADLFRTFQLGSGVYLAVFILTHLNSALISARLVRDIETDWAWASGAPTGLIYDAWNIRLLPHYAFGAFFVLAHLCTGLRQILLAHGLDRSIADRTWYGGLAASAIVSAFIIAALCGARL
jgi:hypothetical protein